MDVYPTGSSPSLRIIRSVGTVPGRANEKIRSVMDDSTFLFWVIVIVVLIIFFDRPQ